VALALPALFNCLRRIVDCWTEFLQRPSIELDQGIKWCPVHALEIRTSSYASPFRQGARGNSDTPPEFKVFGSELAPQSRSIELFGEANPSRARRSEFFRIIHYFPLILPLDGTIDEKQSAQRNE
jgi:hypothetical protein